MLNHSIDETSSPSHSRLPSCSIGLRCQSPENHPVEKFFDFAAHRDKYACCNRTDSHQDCPTAIGAMQAMASTDHDEKIALRADKLFAGRSALAEIERLGKSWQQ